MHYRNGFQPTIQGWFRQEGAGSLILVNVQRVHLLTTILISVFLVVGPIVAFFTILSRPDPEQIMGSLMLIGVCLCPYFLLISPHRAEALTAKRLLLRIFRGEELPAHPLPTASYFLSQL
jgi:hypothetical protein